MNAVTRLTIHAFGSILLLITSCVTCAGEHVRWKVQSAFATNLPIAGDTIMYVSKRLEDMSGGAIQLKVYEPGKLAPAFSILDAVKDRKVEAGFTFIGYDQGKIPSAPLFAARPFGLEPWEFTAWWYEGGGRQLGEEIYAAHNVHPILCTIFGPEAAGWFRHEIKSADDIKGLKIRFAGIGGQVMQKMGASVTVLPAGEIFPALEKGALDATEFSMPAIDEKLGFDKIAKNYYFPGWHQIHTAQYLLVNLDLWKKLDIGSKAAIDTACTAGVMRSLSKGEYLQPQAMKNFAAKGVTARVLPEKLLKALEKVTDEVLLEEAAKDPGFKKVLESQRAFEANYKIWKDKAYLPRSR